MEVWKDVPGYERIYQVSDYGRVRSVDRVVIDYVGDTRRVRNMRGRILAPKKNSASKYLQVALYYAAEKSVKYWYIHRLVMFVFVGACPQGYEVAHYDGDARNNALTNLRYATPRENETDKKRHGTYGHWNPVRGESHGNAILTNDAVRDIYMNRDISAREMSLKYQTSISNVGEIRRGASWTHITARI